MNSELTVAGAMAIAAVLAKVPPQAVPLPADAPNPPVDREAEMRRLEQREKRLEAAGAMRYAMERNPYPDTRQGRRRWQRELVKIASHPGTKQRISHT